MLPMLNLLNKTKFKLIIDYLSTISTGFLISLVIYYLYQNNHVGYSLLTLLLITPLSIMCVLKSKNTLINILLFLLTSIVSFCLTKNTVFLYMFEIVVGLIVWKSCNDRTVWWILENQHPLDDVASFDKIISKISKNQENYEKLVSYCYQKSNLGYLDIVLETFLKLDNIHKRKDNLEIMFMLWADKYAYQVLKKNNIFIKDKAVILEDFITCLNMFCYEEKLNTLREIYKELKVIDNKIYEKIKLSKIRAVQIKFLEILELSDCLNSKNEFNKKIIKI